jgi:hypothetical protein
MKPCPFCSAEIKDDAIYCDHCGKQLDSQTSPNPEQKNKSSKAVGWGCLILIAAFALLWAIGSFKSDDSKTDKAATAKEYKSKDASGIFACRDFYKLLQDMQAGILNDAEIREMAKKINTNARLSDSPNVRDAGQQLLRSITVGTLDDAKEALEGMTAVCVEVNKNSK